MKTTFALFLLLTVLGAFPPLHGQEAISYKISFPNAVHHEARVSITYKNIGADVLELRMSRSSPGRYALHEFAKNVYRVTAEDQQGEPLSIERPSPYQWNIPTHTGYVRVHYTLYADRADGTYSQIDSTHAHLNMPATFMWARNFDQHPIQIEFSEFNVEWKIATQLVPNSRENTFTAPDLQYFMDSPTEISNFSAREFIIASAGKDYTIKLAIHHRAEESDADNFAKMAQTVVEEHIAVYGELPDFDYDSYLFIADYLPHVNSDGMEHRNSTVLTSTRDLGEFSQQLLGTLSHECFHSWNVERLRPKSLQPFNFEQANMSRELWFAEGFTSYYGNLLLRRSALRSEQEYWETLGEIVNSITFSTGRQYFNPIEMSMQAPFVDAATALDPTSFRNTFFSYYSYGAALALALDLTLRSEFEVSLDDYMRRLWLDFGKQESPYAVEDLLATLATVSGDKDFAEDFFNSYIYSSELPDYEKLLAHAGLALVEDDSKSASLGSISIQFNDRKAIIENATLIDSPLYIAGLDRGDQITKIGRYKIRTQRQWDRMLKKSKPGDTVSIEFIQKGESRSAGVTFLANRSITVTPIESEGGEISPAAQVFRNDWLNSKVSQEVAPDSQP